MEMLLLLTAWDATWDVSFGPHAVEGCTEFVEAWGVQSCWTARVCQSSQELHEQLRCILEGGITGSM